VVEAPRRRVSSVGVSLVNRPLVIRRFKMKMHTDGHAASDATDEEAFQISNLIGIHRAAATTMKEGGFNDGCVNNLGVYAFTTRASSFVVRRVFDRVID